MHTTRYHHRIISFKIRHGEAVHHANVKAKNSKNDDPLNSFVEHENINSNE